MNADTFLREYDVELVFVDGDRFSIPIDARDERHAERLAFAMAADSEMGAVLTAKATAAITGAPMTMADWDSVVGL